MGLFKKIKKTVTKPFNKAVEGLTGGRIGGIGDLAKKSALATAGFFGAKNLLGLGVPQSAIGATQGIGALVGSQSGLGNLAGPLLGFAGNILGAKMQKDAYEPPSVDYTGAKKGIQWRVADAKAAGIHPLYALGAPGIGAGATIGASQEPNYGDAVANLGQNLAYMSSQRAQLNNQLLASQIAKLDAETAAIASSPPFDPNASSNRPNAQAFPAEGPYVTEPGTGYTRTHPDSAIGAEEVIGPHVDRWLHGNDAQKREIEQSMVRSLKRAHVRVQEWNPGTRLGAALRKRIIYWWNK